MTDASAPRRRRRIGWIVALAVVVGLLVAAWFIGDAVARDAVKGVVKAKVSEALGIPESHPIDVEVTGAMIPQLIAQKLDHVSVSADDVDLGDVTGDLSGTATGMQFSGAAERITADFAMDADQLRAMLPTDRVQIDELKLDAPDVTISSSFEVFGMPLPLSLTLTPGAVDGELALNPKAITVGGMELTAQQVSNQFGSAADKLLQPWQVCIADKIPAGVHLESVKVAGTQVVASTKVDGAIATDAALQRNGSCG